MKDSRYAQDIERMFRAFPSDLRNKLNNIKREREMTYFRKGRGLTWFVDNYWSIVQQVMDLGPSASELAILLWHLGWRSKTDDPCSGETIRRTLHLKRKALNAAAGCGDDRSGSKQPASEEGLPQANVSQTPNGRTGAAECGEAWHPAAIGGETRNAAAECGDERPGSEQRVSEEGLPQATASQAPIEAGAADCGEARHSAAIGGEMRNAAAECGDERPGSERRASEEGLPQATASQAAIETGAAECGETRHSAAIGGEMRNAAAECGDERSGSEQWASDEGLPQATASQTPIGRTGAAKCGDALSVGGVEVADHNEMRRSAAIRDDARQNLAKCGGQRNEPDRPDPANLRRGAFRTSSDTGAAMCDEPEPDAVTGDAMRYEEKHSSQTVLDTCCDEEAIPYLIKLDGSKNLAGLCNF